MVARSSPDGHSWSNHIPSSAGDIQGGCFLRCVLSFFSRSFRFSHRGYFQLGSLPQISSLPQYVWPLLCSCTRVHRQTTIVAPIRQGFQYQLRTRSFILRLCALQILPYCPFVQRQNSLASLFTSPILPTYPTVSSLLYPYD